MQEVCHRLEATPHLCSRRYKDPRGTNWVTMDRLGARVQAPMNSTTLGCFNRFMMLTSALNSCSTGAENRCCSTMTHEQQGHS